VVFKANIFRKSQRAYKSVFDLNNPDVKFILKDLAWQAKIGRSVSARDKPCSDQELREAEGRRLMYWYITRKINLTPEEEREILNGRTE